MAPLKKYFFLFIACFTIFLVHLIVIRHGIYGDGNGYYSFTQALYFDKRLNFKPIYNYLEHFQGVKGEFSRISWDTRTDPYPIGTGIIWIPSVALMSLFTPDRFSQIIEIGPGLTGIILVLFGLYFLERYLQNFFSKKISLFSVLIFFFCSNLFYYASFEPALSHQPAFFIISFLLYKTYKMRQTALNYSLVGALSGLLFITRVPDSILLIQIYWQLFKNHPAIKHLAIAVFWGLVFLLPMAISYQIMYGDPLHMPYLHGGDIGSFSFSVSKIFEFFFSAKRGLFSWTPIYAVGLIGLVLFRKYAILIALAILILVSASWSGYTSAGFGQRFVLSAIPYFALGLAVLIQKLKLKYSLILTSILLIWNFLTLFQFYFNGANMIRNENFTLTQFLSGQFQTPVNVIRDARLYGIKNVFQKEVLD